jgi:hypothetical protein
VPAWSDVAIHPGRSGDPGDEQIGSSVIVEIANRQAAGDCRCAAEGQIALGNIGEDSVPIIREDLAALGRDD